MLLVHVHAHSKRQMCKRACCVCAFVFSPMCVCTNEKENADLPTIRKAVHRVIDAEQDIKTIDP